MLLTCIDVVLGLQLCHEFSILQHGGRFVPTQMFYTILVYRFESCSYNEYQEIASISRQDGGWGKIPGDMHYWKKCSIFTFPPSLDHQMFLTHNVVYCGTIKAGHSLCNKNLNHEYKMYGRINLSRDSSCLTRIPEKCLYRLHSIQTLYQK